MTTWDKIYKNYQKGGPAYASLGFEIYPLFKKFISRSNFQLKSALDIGCGDGRYLKYLQRLGFKIDGIDSSPTAVEITRKLFKNNSRIKRVDMYQYRIPAEKYDFIFSINTLQHGKKAAIKRVINRIFRSLKDGGKIIITLPSVLQVKRWHSFKDSRKLLPGTYVPQTGPEKGLPHSFFTKKEIKKLFSEFKRVKMEMDKRGRWFITAEK